MGGFRGDLSTLGLADIFQTLSNSQKEGTLVVGDGESRKCIYFGREGLSLVSLGSRKGLRIGDLLLKIGKISPDQLKDLLAAQKGSGKKLGEIIVERGIATEEDISGVIRTQIEDEIFDLFSWKKASFEFIDGPPAPELTDADRPVTSLKFDVNALLFEASRRIDEWSLINQAIPSFNTIFVLTEAGKKLSEADKEPALRTIAHLTDASHTVDQIVDESGLSRFNACKALYTLLTQNGLRRVSQEELTSLGKKLATTGERERAIRVLSSAVELDHENLVPQQELATVLRQAGRDEEAYVHYREMGRIYQTRGRVAEAIQAFRQALQCRANEPDASFSLFQLYQQSREAAESARIAERLFPVLLSSGDRDRARQLGEALVASRPNDTDVRLRVAALCQDLGDSDACGRHLSAAVEHLRGADAADTEAIGRKALAVLPNRTDIRFKIERILETKRAARKQRYLRFGLIAGAFLLATGGTVFGIKESAARSAWAAAVKDGEGMVAAKEYDKAVELYRKFEAAWGMSLVAGRVEGKIQEVVELQQKEQLEGAQADSDMRRQARIAEEGQRKRLEEGASLEAAATPDLPKALKIYEEVRTWAAEKKSEKLEADAKELVTRLNELLKRSASIWATVEEQARTGQVESAHRLARDLLRTCPKTPEALAAKLPYSVQSTPPGADVLLAGTPIGRTPAVVWVTPEREVEVVVRLRTFEDLTRKLQPGVPIHLVELAKVVLWKRQIQDEIQTTPASFGQTVLFGGLDGKLYAIDASKPDVTPWAPYEVSFGNAIQSSPLVHGERVYFGANDGTMYCLNATTGRREWAVKTSRPIKCDPALSPDGTTIYAGSNDGKLYAFHAISGEVRWKAEASKPVRSRPHCGRDRVYFGADDNRIRAVDAANGKQMWEVPTGGPVAGPISAWNGFLVAGCEDGLMYVVDLDGKVDWTYDAGKGIAGGVCVSGDVAFFGTLGGHLHAVDLRTRKDAWPKIAISTKSVRGAPVFGDEAVYVGSDDGTLYALELKTGAVRWKYTTGGAIVGSPALLSGTRNLIFVGSADKHLYALER